MQSETEGSVAAGLVRSALEKRVGDWACEIDDGEKVCGGWACEIGDGEKGRRLGL